MDKIIYSCHAPFEATKKAAAAASIALLVVCAFLSFLVSHMPYSGILSVLVIIVFASLLYSVMKRSLFDITYVLYENRLVFVRRFGAVSSEAEVFPLSEAKFFEDKIIYNNKQYPFHPDDKLKELLL